MTPTRALSAAFIRIAELGLAVEDGKPINRKPGAWRHSFTVNGWAWDVAVNGHREPVASPLSDDATMEPYEAHVYVNGWPFAVLTPYDGFMARGEGANEDTFLAALAVELDRVTAARAPRREGEQ